MRAPLIGVALLPSLAFGVTLGQPVSEALDELQQAGLNIVYSSVLVPASLRVTVQPADGTPAERARQLLSAHGLELRDVGSGRFVVVRRPFESRSAALPNTASQPAPQSTSPPPEPQVLSIYAARMQPESQPTLPSTQISRTEIKQLPALNQDALHALKRLPGTSSAGLSARTHVRGGREDELAVYFDGVPLYEPFHFKDFQTLVGVVDPSTMSSLQLFNGVLPAAYGNALSGVIDIQPRRWEGRSTNELGTSFLQSHLLSHGRLKSFPVEWLFTSRQSELGVIPNPLSSGVVEPSYSDLLARVVLGSSTGAQFTIGYMALNDDIAGNTDGIEERAIAHYNDDTGWIAWRQRWSSDRISRVLLSSTQLETRREGELSFPHSTQASLSDRRLLRATTVRAHLFDPSSMRFGWDVGVEGTYYAARYEMHSQAEYEPVLARAFGREPSFTRDIELRHSGSTRAAYGSVHWQVNDRLATDIGVRLDSHDFGRSEGTELNPRLSVEYRMTENTALRVAFGSQSQTHRPHELNVADGETQLRHDERAQQAVMSIEHHLSDSVDVRTEVYAKRISNPAPYFENLLDPLSLAPELSMDRVRVVPESTRISGVETSLQWRPADALAVWLNYAWTEATDQINGRSVPRTWNSAHALNGGVSWTSTPWAFSAAASLRDGWRMTPLIDTTGTLDGVIVGERNADHWSIWFSLDLRATWSRPLRIGVLRVFAELNNATNSDPYCCIDRLANVPGADSLGRTRNDGLPLYPFLGFTWGIE